MSRITSNPECWNCGNTVSNDKVCPKCGEHLDDDPELDEEWSGVYNEEDNTGDIDPHYGED